MAGLDILQHRASFCCDLLRILKLPVLSENCSRPNSWWMGPIDLSQSLQVWQTEKPGAQADVKEGGCRGDLSGWGLGQEGGKVGAS